MASKTLNFVSLPTPKSSVKSPSMAKLILTSGEQRQEFELAAINTIGRHPDNSIQILDRIISKEHAQILRGADGQLPARATSARSTARTSAARASPSIVLKHGDELVLGSTHLMFVEQTETDESLQRVTIAPSSLESHRPAQGRRAAANRDFLPEKQIADVEHLRRDYEKLRIAPRARPRHRRRARPRAAAAARSSTRRSSCCPPTAASSCSTTRTAS